ncbi:hypothetical protein [Bacillus thuringiensis]|uniref:hypothetical protein n=1 Tax=Bacillus thuringiensis TaxID=1428 RepID=UPI002DBD4C29|nr:hypothetical protein [Bacillus thuringiensis]MEC3460100.1 hypothetical protein [Bacillus thuringiensis]
MFIISVGNKFVKHISLNESKEITEMIFTSYIKGVQEINVDDLDIYKKALEDYIKEDPYVIIPVGTPLAQNSKEHILDVGTNTWDLASDKNKE